MFKITAFQVCQKLRNANFYEMVLIFVLLAGIIATSSANMTGEAVIHNMGRMIPAITAKSGYWRDIQDAVDLAASLGGGIVRIPEGTWNFVNVSESWTGARVTIPAGISLFGATTERYPNGSVVEWRTVLVMPWDMPGSKSYYPPHWFLMQGTSDPSKPSRFSDIKLVGYKDLNLSATGFYRGICVSGVVDFRIDHCSFKEVPEGIAVGLNTRYSSCGVIDHNVFDNEYASYNLDWATRNVGYAIDIYRQESETKWQPLTDLLGKYVDYTIFIEDNVFTKWRSVVSGNYGAHYVFRYNTVIYGLAVGEVDLHPSWNSPYVGCRAVEVYGNTFTSPDPAGNIYGLFAVEMHSGSGVFFNNTVSGHETFIRTNNAGWSEVFYPHDIYIWDNNIGKAIVVDGSAILNDDYFLYKPDSYAPYPYPHPLTLM